MRSSIVNEAVDFRSRFQLIEVASVFWILDTPWNAAWPGNFRGKKKHPEKQGVMLNVARKVVAALSPSSLRVLPAVLKPLHSMLYLSTYVEPVEPELIPGRVVFFSLSMHLATCRQIPFKVFHFIFEGNFVVISYKG